jgi:hypothetical protein
LKAGAFWPFSVRVKVTHPLEHTLSLVATVAPTRRLPKRE